MKSDDVNRMIGEMSEKHVHKSDELKDLRKEVAELRKALAEQRDLVRLLKEEVGFAERGYTKMGRNDG